MKVPGCLYAKSLSVDSSDNDSYQWFFKHSCFDDGWVKAVTESIIWQDAFFKGPILMVRELSDGKACVVRITRQLGDVKGRLHNRYEFLMLDADAVENLLTGEFDALPNLDSATFEIRMTSEGLPLPSICPGARVNGYDVCIYGQPGMLCMKSETPVNHQQLPRVNETKARVGASKGGSAMKKFLFVLALIGIGLNVVQWHMNSEKQNENERLKRNNAECRRDIEDLKNAKRTLESLKKELNDKLETQNNELKSKRNEIEVLRSDVAKLKSTINNTKLSPKEKDEKLASLEQSNAVLTDAITKAKEILTDALPQKGILSKSKGFVPKIWGKGK